MIPSPYPCIAPTGATRTRFSATPHYPEGLYDLGADCYAWIVPNGSWGEANAGLVLGDGEAVLVDTLWDVPNTQVMLETINQTLNHPQIRTVINTHADGDHWWGNQLLPNAKFITSRASQAEMRHKRPGQMLALARLGRLLQTMGLKNWRQAGDWFVAMGAPYDFNSVRPRPAEHGFEGRSWLSIGGREIHLIEVGPAHTAGDLIVHVPDAGVIYAADVMFLNSTPVMWAGPVENWLEALATLRKLAPRVIVPGHGPLTDLSGVEAVEHYLRFIADRLRIQFDQGATARAAAFRVAQSAAFQNQDFARWEAPERIMTNAYILFRHWRGQSRPPSLPVLLKILYDQAQLAAALNDA